jgi:ABC-type dipeptide/oligopeptide/nickel transport system ATPase component
MLNIEHLSVEYYRRGKTIPAVRDVSLTLAPGETLGLVGESGSGKSTLALAILRLIAPNEGRITCGKIIFGESNLLCLKDSAMRQIRGRDISMIFQDPFTALNPVMRVRDQMAEVLEAHGIRPPVAADVGSDPLVNSLRQVQLDPERVLEAYPHLLSGGQRQRVLIAMSLLTRPKLLLADEPTTALDVLVQKDILDLLFRLQRELGMAMLFISHNLGLVANYTQRIAVMKEGRLVEEGETQTLFRQPRDSYTKELIEALPAMTRGIR